MTNATATQHIVNGVNVTELSKTIAAVGEAPKIAEFKFRLENKWNNGGANRSHIAGFYGACEEIERDRGFILDADEPEILLGRDSGANPVEFVLHALAACMTTGIVYHAAARGIVIEELSSKLEGDLNLKGFLGLDNENPRGYSEIRVKFTVKTDAPESELHELYQFSPVYDMVKRSLPVKVEFDYV
ncbi:MAG TPA: OsmC family protein [candidate division Zixibacteria bacterium]|nr:OsmC family protein [candidate division Zixibacteria bacterium]